MILLLKYFLVGLTLILKILKELLFIKIKDKVKRKKYYKNKKVKKLSAISDISFTTKYNI